MSDQPLVETLKRIHRRKEARGAGGPVDLGRVDARLRAIQQRQTVAARQARRLADSLGPHPVQQSLAIVGPAGGRTGARFVLRNDQQREIEPEFVISGATGSAESAQRSLRPGESCVVRIDLDLAGCGPGAHPGHLDVLDGTRRLLRVWLDVEALDPGPS